MKSFSYFSSLSFNSFESTSFSSSTIPSLIQDHSLDYSIIQNYIKFNENNHNYKQDIWKNRVNSLKNDSTSLISSVFSFLIHKYSSIPPEFLLKSLFSLNFNNENELFNQKFYENSLDFKLGILHQPMNPEPRENDIINDNEIKNTLLSKKYYHNKENLRKKMKNSSKKFFNNLFHSFFDSNTIGDNNLENSYSSSYFPSSSLSSSHSFTNTEWNLNSIIELVMLREELIELAKEVEILSLMKNFYPYSNIKAKVTPNKSTENSNQSNGNYFSYYKNMLEQEKNDLKNENINNNNEEEVKDDEEDDEIYQNDFSNFLKIIKDLNDDDFFYFFSDISSDQQLFSSLANLNSSGLLTKKNDDDYILDSIIIYGYQQALMPFYYKELKGKNKNNENNYLNEEELNNVKENHFFSILAYVSLLIKMITNLSYIIKLINSCKKSLNDYGLANTGLGLRILSFIGIKNSFKYNLLLENERENILKSKNIEEYSNNNELVENFLQYVPFDSISKHSDDILTFVSTSINYHQTKYASELSNIYFFNLIFNLDSQMDSQMDDDSMDVVEKKENNKIINNKLLFLSSYSFQYYFIISLFSKETEEIKKQFFSLLLRLFPLYIQNERGVLVISKSLTGLLPPPLDRVIDPPLSILELWSGIYSLQDEKLSSKKSEFSTSTNLSPTSRFLSTYFINPLLNSLGDNILLPLSFERCQGPGPCIIRNKKQLNSSILKSEFLLDSAIKGNITSYSNKNNNKMKWKWQINPSKLSIFDLIEQIFSFFSFFYTEIIHKNEILSLEVGQCLLDSPIDLKNALKDAIISSMPLREEELDRFITTLRPACEDLEDLLENSFSFSNYNEKKISIRKKILVDLQKKYIDLHNDDYENIEDVKNNEDKMEEINENPKFLSHFLNELPSIYFRNLRTKILKDARSILSSDYNNTTIAHGDSNEDKLENAGKIGEVKVSLFHFSTIPQVTATSSSTSFLNSSYPNLDTSFASKIVNDSEKTSKQVKDDDEEMDSYYNKLQFNSCQVSLLSLRLLNYINNIMSEACLIYEKKLEDFYSLLKKEENNIKKKKDKTNHFISSLLPSNSSSLIENSLNNFELASNILYHSSRDCFDLFITTIKLKFKEIISNNLYYGAIFYNDCQYLAHNCIILGNKYKKKIKKIIDKNYIKLSEIYKENNNFYSNYNPFSNYNENDSFSSSCFLLSNSINFVDFIPKLNDLSEEVILGHIKREVEFILQALKKVNFNILPISRRSKNSISNSSSIIENNEEYVIIILKKIFELYKNWHTVLQIEAYNIYFSIIVNSLLNNIIEIILCQIKKYNQYIKKRNDNDDEIIDIKKEQISSLLKMFLKINLFFTSSEQKLLISSTFYSSSSYSFTSIPSASLLYHYKISSYCPSWKKFVIFFYLFSVSITEICNKNYLGFFYSNKFEVISSHEYSHHLHHYYHHYSESHSVLSTNSSSSINNNNSYLPFFSSNSDENTNNNLKDINFTKSSSFDFSKQDMTTLVYFLFKDNDRRKYLLNSIGLK